MVEKVVFDKFFYNFYDSKDFLNNSWKKWKKLSKTIFSTTQAVLEAQIVEKVVFDNFSTIVMVPETSSTIRGKSGKVGLATF